MLALVDSDTPLFSAALSAENETESWKATSRLDRTIENILQSTGCTDYKLFVSGKNNFRKQIDPLYKANRTQPEPKWREVCKQHLIDKWGAIEAHGCEADDYCGIYQNADSIICGIDKDLLQIPGQHFRWEIVRNNKVVRPMEFVEVSELDGLKAFYKQVLTGDTSDNIIGVQGIGPVKAAKIIDPLETEEEMIDVVKELYSDSERFFLNCDLLWIMRNLGEIYADRNK